MEYGIEHAHRDDARPNSGNDVHAAGSMWSDLM